MTVFNNNNLPGDEEERPYTDNKASQLTQAQKQLPVIREKMADRIPDAHIERKFRYKKPQYDFSVWDGSAKEHLGLGDWDYLSANDSEEKLGPNNQKLPEGAVGWTPQGLPWFGGNNAWQEFRKGFGYNLKKNTTNPETGGFRVLKAGGNVLLGGLEAFGSAYSELFEKPVQTHAGGGRQWLDAWGDMSGIDDIHGLVNVENKGTLSQQLSYFTGKKIQLPKWMDKAHRSLLNVLDVIDVVDLGWDSYRALKARGMGIKAPDKEDFTGKAGRIAYSTWENPALREEFNRRLANGENAYLLELELRDPITELVGSVLLDPGIIFTQFGKAWKGRQIAKTLDGMINTLSPEWGSVVSKIDEITDSTKLDDLVEANQRFQARIGTKLDDQKNANNFFSLSNQGKREFLNETSNQIGRYIVDVTRFKDGTINPDKAMFLMRAVYNLASDNADEVAQAIKEIGSLHKYGVNAAPLLSEAGGMFSKVLRQIGDNLGGLDKLGDSFTKAEKFEDSLKIIDDATQLATKKIFPTLSQTAKVLEKAGKRLPLGQRALLRMENTAQKMQGLNRFFAHIYMGMSPGYAARNLLSNSLHIIFDEGFSAMFGRIATHEGYLKEVYGTVIEAARRGIGTAGFKSYSDQGWGWKRLVGAGLELGQKGERRSSVRLVSAATKRALKTMLQPGRAIPEIEPLINAGWDIQSARHLQNLMIKYNGNVGKVTKVFRSELKEGGINLFKSLGWLDGPMRDLADDYDITLWLRNVVDEVEDVDEFVEMVATKFDTMFDEATEFVAASMPDVDLNDIIARRIEALIQGGGLTDDQARLVSAQVQQNKITDNLFADAALALNEEAARRGIDLDDFFAQNPKLEPVRNLRGFYDEWDEFHRINYMDIVDEAYAATQKSRRADYYPLLQKYGLPLGEGVRKVGKKEFKDILFNGWYHPATRVIFKESRERGATLVNKFHELAFAGVDDLDIRQLHKANEALEHARKMDFATIERVGDVIPQAFDGTQRIKRFMRHYQMDSPEYVRRIVNKYLRGEYSAGAVEVLAKEDVRQIAKTADLWKEKPELIRDALRARVLQGDHPMPPNMTEDDFLRIIDEFDDQMVLTYRQGGQRLSAEEAARAFDASSAMPGRKIKDDIPDILNWGDDDAVTRETFQMISEGAEGKLTHSQMDELVDEINDVATTPLEWNKRANKSTKSQLLKRYYDEIVDQNDLLEDAARVADEAPRVLPYDNLRTPENRIRALEHARDRFEWAKAGDSEIIGGKAEGELWDDLESALHMAGVEVTEIAGKTADELARMLEDEIALFRSGEKVIDVGIPLDELDEARLGFAGEEFADTSWRTRQAPSVTDEAADVADEMDELVEMLAAPHEGNVPPTYAYGVKGKQKQLEQLKEFLIREGRHTWGQYASPVVGQEDALAKWLTEATSRTGVMRYAAEQVATKARDFALHNYSKRHNFDTALGILYPYNFWYSRTYPNWLRRVPYNAKSISDFWNYRESLETLHAGMPDWWKWNINTNELLGMDVKNPLYFNLEMSLNPMYGIMGVDFEDPHRRVDFLTRTIDDMNKFGPTTHTAINWLLMLKLYAQGEKDAAARWAGRMGQFPRFLTGAKATLGFGGEDLDPIVRIFAGDTDPYTEQAVNRALAAMQAEGYGDYSPEQFIEAAYAKEGDLWDAALQRVVQERFPGYTSSYMLGAGFRMRNENDIAIDVMYDEYFSLLNNKENLSPDEFSLQMDYLARKYQFMDTVLIGMKDDDKRDTAYAWHVLRRIPPGESFDTYQSVGLDQRIVDKFYTSRGDMTEWAESDRERFMAAIVDVSAVLAIPDWMTQREWTTAKSLWKQLDAQIKMAYGEGINDRIDEYYAIKQDQGEDAAYGYLDRNPAVARAMELKRAGIVNGPPELQAYYSSTSKIQLYYNTLKWNEAKRRFGKEIFNISAGYSLAEDKDAYKKKYPQLEDYWAFNDTFNPTINQKIAELASQIPEGIPATIREDFLEGEEGIGAQDLYQDLTSPTPGWTVQDWVNTIGESAMELVVDSLRNNRSLSYRERQQLDRAAERAGLEDSNELIQQVGITMYQMPALPEP